MYKIDIAVKDVKGNRVGTLARSLRVPEFDEEKLASSSLILADLMERAPAKSSGANNFILGEVKIRPRPDSADGKPAGFQRSQSSTSGFRSITCSRTSRATRTRPPSVSTSSTSRPSRRPCILDEPSSAFGGNGDQITIRTEMPLASLAPGTYKLNIAIKDELSKQTITPSARFQVE